MIDTSISWDDYVAIKRMNPSTLVYGRRSMKALRRVITEGFWEASDVMVLGTSIHSLLLEPDEFEERFAVMPSYHLDADNCTQGGKSSTSRATKYCEEMEAGFVRAIGSKTLLLRSQYDTALTCIESIRSRPAMVEIIEHSHKEVTVLGEIDGIECKGRIDLLHPSKIVDLKNTADVSERKFKRIFDDLGYAFKLAMYRELVRQNTVGVRDVEIIAQETSGDFDNVLYTLPSDWLDDAMNDVMRVIAMYKQSLATGVWPGVDGGQDRVELERPYWQKKEADQSDWSSIDVGATIGAEEEAYF